MARGAIARLYDVDDDAVGFNRFNIKKKYDHAAVTFRAKKGKLVDLRKMRESLWATRLSGGTSSGVICLKVNAVGTVVLRDGETVLQIEGADRQFILVNDVAAKPDDAEPGVLESLRQAVAGGESKLSVTGYMDGWVGRWPNVLKQPMVEPPRMMVIDFQAADEESE